MIQIKTSARIRSLRKEQGMKQTKLANRLGVTPNCLCQWEHDHSRPSFEDLAMIAEIFHTTTDYLIGVTDERNRA